MSIISKYKSKIGVAVVLAAFLAGAFMIPNFLQISNLLNVIRQSSVVAICAIGVTMVIITKGIDLSIGGTISFSAMISGLMMLSGVSIILALICGAATGIVIGLLNGFMIAKIGVPPFITTLVMGQVTQGFALVLSNGRSIGAFPDGYVFLGNGEFLGIPISNFIMVLFVVAGVLVMIRTRIGSRLYALGGNEMVVKQEGIKTSRIIFFAYGTSGFCAAIGGMLLSAQMDTVHPIQGDPYLLDTIAACVVGGVNLMGGEGKIELALVGSLVIGMMRNALNLLGMHPFYQNIFIGVIIIGVVSINVLSKARKTEKAKVF